MEKNNGKRIMEFNKPPSRMRLCFVITYKAADGLRATCTHTHTRTLTNYLLFFSSVSALAKLSQVQGHNCDHLL